MELNHIKMSITLEQFKKFANDNDILWFYNKPHWRTTPYWRGARYNHVVIDEFRKMFYDNDDLDSGRLKLIQNFDPKTKLIDRLLHWQKVLNQKREEQMKVNLEIAKLCFEANKQYCRDNGIFHTNKTWDEMSDQYREGIVLGVAQVIADPEIKPEEMHQNWLDSKEADGWSYGKVIDYDEKLHPNMVPFKKLDKAEQAKDRLFIATIRAEMKK